MSFINSIFGLFGGTSNSPQTSAEPANPIDVTEKYIPDNMVKGIDVSFLRGYQPRDIDDILGSNYYFPKWQLYHTIEASHDRVLKNITYLKHSVSNKKILVKPFDTSPEAKKKAELVQTAIYNMTGNSAKNENNFKQMVEDIVSAYGFGINVQELLYEEKDGLFLPYASQYVSAYSWDFNLQNASLYFKHGLNRYEIPDNKFLISIFRNRSSDNMSSFGVYQTVVKLLKFQALALEYLMKYTERFSIPVRMVKYPRDMEQAQINLLATKMAQMGASGYSVVPQGTDMEVINGIASQYNPQESLIEFVNKEIDITMLGQNLTTDVQGGSFAATKEHTAKENNIINFLTNFVTDVLSTQYVPHILLANEETLDKKPWLTFDMPKDFDELSKKMTVVKQLKDIGYEVDSDVLRSDCEEYGIIINPSSTNRTTGSI